MARMLLKPGLLRLAIVTDQLVERGAPSIYDSPVESKFVQPGTMQTLS